MSKIPAFGLGTFRLQGQVAIDSVRNGLEVGDPTIGAIAQRRHATPAQVALAWALQLGYSVIPSSTKRENLASNLLAQTLRLTDEDMAQIAALERNGREVDPAGLAPQWD